MLESGCRLYEKHQEPSLKQTLHKMGSGKNQLLEQFEEYYPNKLRKGKVKNCIEFFFRKGALFFIISRRYQIEKYQQSLILTYQVIQ